MLKLVIRLPHVKGKKKKDFLALVEKALKSNEPLDKKELKKLLDEVEIVPHSILDGKTEGGRMDKVSIFGSKIIKKK